MNIYKFYFNHLIEAVEKFKSDFKYSFIVEDILKKLTLEPPKNSINGDMSTNLAMILSKDLKLSPKIIAENFMVYISNFPGVDMAAVNLLTASLERRLAMMLSSATGAASISNFSLPANSRSSSMAPMMI